MACWFPSPWWPYPVKKKEEVLTKSITKKKRAVKNKEQISPT